MYTRPAKNQLGYKPETDDLLLLEGLPGFLAGVECVDVGKSLAIFVVVVAVDELK